MRKLPHMKGFDELRRLHDYRSEEILHLDSTKGVEYPCYYVNIYNDTKVAKL